MAAHRFDPLLHADQTKMTALDQLRRVAGRIETTPIVAHAEKDFCRLQMQAHADLSGLRVPHGISKRLLGNTEETERDRPRESRPTFVQLGGNLGHLGTTLTL